MAKAIAEAAEQAACPAEMLQVNGFCIDRWEISTIDKKTGKALSPYYPPHPRLFAYTYNYWQLQRRRAKDESVRNYALPQLPDVQRRGHFEPVAVSKPGVVPQGYLSFYTASKACKNAGKRLCTQDEWVKACRGRRRTKYPYGANFSAKPCNVYRHYHPAFVLHRETSVGHLDPRLNLVVERGIDPLLRVTGGSPECKSIWDGGALYDMVGNLDEWVDDEKGVFVGGFYARSTTEGCDSSISSHSPLYFDYSTGARCCRGLRGSSD